MKHIQQVIVVEGKHDSATLKQHFDCETIETGGTHLSKETISQIQKAQKETGVIIFTDPDYPGTYLRNQINEQVPGCMHAYIMKEDARTTKKVGIEHASKEVLEQALEHLVSWQEKEESLSYQEMFQLGLLGEPSSQELRKKVGAFFGIGYGNGKTMWRRLNQKGITKKQIEEVIHE